MPIAHGLKYAISFVMSIAVVIQTFADEYPSRPVRVITGNPGATADILARQLGRRLTERWGQQIVVDNRGGAAATIAAEITAKAAPDGYTLLMGQLNSHALAVSLHKRLSYDPVTDFAAITRVASAPQVLVVTRTLKSKTWQEFAEHARLRPGMINYASAGHGTASHLTTEFLKQAAKLDLVHINYKGGGLQCLPLQAVKPPLGSCRWQLLYPSLSRVKSNYLPLQPYVAFPHYRKFPH